MALLGAFLLSSGGAIPAGRDSEASGFEKNGYEAAIEDSDDRLDEVAGSWAAAGRLRLLGPLFAFWSPEADGEGRAREPDAVVVVVSESRTTGLPEALRLTDDFGAEAADA